MIVEPYSIISRIDFINLLEGKIAPVLIDKIMLAYKLSKYAHKGQTRSNGERYFEHPHRVTRLLIEEWGIYDHEILIAALLHDVPEDTFMLNTDDISTMFGDRAGTLVKAVTKRKVISEEHAVILNNTDISNFTNDQIIGFVTRHTRERVSSNANFPNKIYVKWIRAVGGEDAVILKFADRISNLREIKDLDDIKIQRIVDMTKKLYLNLLPYYHSYRVSLEGAISNVELYLTENKRIALLGVHT